MPANWKYCIYLTEGEKSIYRQAASYRQSYFDEKINVNGYNFQTVKSDSDNMLFLSLFCSFFIINCQSPNSTLTLLITLIQNTHKRQIITYKILTRDKLLLHTKGNLHYWRGLSIWQIGLICKATWLFSVPFIMFRECKYSILSILFHVFR